MPKPKTRKRDDPAQSRAFIKKAREVDADEERSEADDILGVLHTKPHEPHPQRTKKSHR